MRRKSLSAFKTKNTPESTWALRGIRLFGSGGGIRTPDLRVMSPTSYLAALPRNKFWVADTMGPRGFVNRE